MTAKELIEEALTEENMDTNPMAIKLALVLQSCIYQRDRWAGWYIATRTERLNQLTEKNKDNAELDRIVGGGST